MTATEMIREVDRILKLGEALGPLRERLVECQGRVGACRAALDQAEAEEQSARGELERALASGDALPPVLAVTARDLAPRFGITMRAADNDRLCADPKLGPVLTTCGSQLELEWVFCGDGIDDENVYASDLEQLDVERITFYLDEQDVWYRVHDSEGEPVRTHEPKPAAPAAKPAKPPRKPRPSECWTVWEGAPPGMQLETFRGGKVDAERHYRAREKVLATGERIELRTPKGDMLVCCEGKAPTPPAEPPQRWHVETRDVGADAWNAGSFGYDDEAEARREYQYALDNSKPGEAVRLRRPGGGHEGEVTVPETAATTDAPPVAEMSAEALERALRLAVDVAELKSIWFDNAKKVDVAGLKRASEVFRERVVALGGTAGDDAAPAEGEGSDDARCDELLRTRTRHPHVVLAWPGGGGAGPDWGVVFEGATLGSALKAQRAAVKRLRGTGGRVRRYENAALVETLPVAPGGGAARPAGGAAATAAAEVSP